jgi:hypothetical protein
LRKEERLNPRTTTQAYLIDDIHMNPEIYSDPTSWDPSRYLPDRAEDKKAPHAYLGWGVARHPCREFASNDPVLSPPLGLVRLELPVGVPSNVAT